jgi:ABC-2 type transport system ATP-binding protein
MEPSSNHTVYLTASNLSRNFGEIKAVDGVSLELRAGQCLAVLGPNGAGKTTLIEIMEGLTVADSGQLQVLGLQYKHQRQQIQQLIGVLLQETTLYKRFTVRETWELFGAFFSSSVAVSELAHTLDLESKLDVQLKNLSGGQKQRVYLGCALVNQPKILFLDEPTTGLDPQARRQIWELVKKLKEQGTAVLLTTHYMEEATVLADQVAVMDAGKIIARGAVEPLIKEHCGSAVLELRGDIVQLGSALKDMLSKFESKVIFSDSGRQELGFENELQALDAAKFISERASTEELQLRSAAVRRSSLEDVFLRVAQRSLADV